MSLPDAVDISRVRGDTYPFVFTVQDSDGSAIDITGFTFTLTVDPEESPVDAANNLFALTGSVLVGADGTVEFQPTTEQSDQEPAGYYYDLQMTDLSTDIRTIAKGAWTVVQDITK